MQHLIFVYGTFREGECHHHVLENCQALGEFHTLPEFALYEINHQPVVSSGANSISGEIYLVDDDTLKKLDTLKNVPTEFYRSQIDTNFGVAWIYLYKQNLTTGELITSGNWRKRV